MYIENLAPIIFKERNKTGVNLLYKILYTNHHWYALFCIFQEKQKVIFIVTSLTMFNTVNRFVET